MRGSWPTSTAGSSSRRARWCRRAREAFERFDANRDGQIDRRELRHALRHYGVDVTRDEAARVLDAYDDRPDRRLDLVEFSNLVQDLELGVVRTERPPTPGARPPTPGARPPRPKSANPAGRLAQRRPPTPDVALGRNGKPLRRLADARDDLALRYDADSLSDDDSFCQHDYGISPAQIQQNINASNAHYGAGRPDLSHNATRILYVNGDVDPWSGLGCGISTAGGGGHRIAG